MKIWTIKFLVDWDLKAKHLEDTDVDIMDIIDISLGTIGTVGDGTTGLSMVDQTHRKSRKK